MTITNPAGGYRRSSSHDDPLLGPRAAFLATAAATGLIAFGGLLPSELVMPAVTTLLFALAMVFALVAWIRCSTDEYRVTYWDVAGAVALIGTCTAALIEPDQMVRLVAGAPTEN